MTSSDNIYQSRVRNMGQTPGKYDDISTENERDCLDLAGLLVASQDAIGEGFWFNTSFHWVSFHRELSNLINDLITISILPFWEMDWSIFYIINQQEDINLKLINKRYKIFYLSLFHKTWLSEDNWVRKWNISLYGALKTLFQPMLFRHQGLIPIVV